MTVGKVVGSVVATPKHEALSGVKLLLVRRYIAGKPSGSIVIAADSVKTAGRGSFVYMVDSSEAAASFRRGLIPVDLAIVGIIDRYNSVKCELEQS